MTREQIRATVTRFATTAALAERAGVRRLSRCTPHMATCSRNSSRRWSTSGAMTGAGGWRTEHGLLLDVVRAIRMVVSSSFTVAVQAELPPTFKRGGFDASDGGPGDRDGSSRSGSIWSSSPAAATRAPRWPARPADARTAAREAYFLELAAELARTKPRCR